MANGFVLIDAVMTALGMAGNEELRSVIQPYIDETNAFLTDAGVPSDVIGTETTVGVVARGVADLWNYGAGDGKLSSYFYQRAIQLAVKEAN